MQISSSGLEFPIIEIFKKTTKNNLKQTSKVHKNLPKAISYKLFDDKRNRPDKFMKLPDKQIMSLKIQKFKNLHRFGSNFFI
jgi:hypothetical protein